MRGRMFWVSCDANTGVRCREAMETDTSYRDLYAKARELGWSIGGTRSDDAHFCPKHRHVARFRPSRTPTP